MALPKYKVTQTGSEEITGAAEIHVDDTWIVFMDDGGERTRLRASKVLRIDRVVE